MIFFVLLECVLNEKSQKSRHSPLLCHYVPIPSYRRCPPCICDTDPWFHVGQVLLHLGVYVWLELLMLTAVQNSAFLTLWLRFPHGGKHRFLIPFWNLWGWGLAGNSGCRGTTGELLQGRWQEHVCELPRELLLLQGMAWKLTSGSPPMCGASSGPNSCQLIAKTILPYLVLDSLAQTRLGWKVLSEFWLDGCLVKEPGQG